MSERTVIDQTDLTFFTNEEGRTLLSRFKSTLKDTHTFDVLVGYFRASGFYQLQDALEPLEKIRILVGLNLDRATYAMLQSQERSGLLDFESHQKTKRQYRKNLREEVENSEENEHQLEDGIRKFIEFLRADRTGNPSSKISICNGKKLEIRAYPTKDIHAKVYIGRFRPEDRDYGYVITGSSNFSASGLVAKREFNVELRSRQDVRFAEQQFEALWAESVDVSEEFVETIQQETWLNDQISPYELYLKLIYEYLEEDINLEEDFDPYLPAGFMKLKYQSQAAIQARKILETYNGVFLADVVGLGKTFITALLLQQLRGRTLVVCPPVLQDYWKDSLFDFGIRSFVVESLGKLDHIIRKGTEKFDYIVVDEAHRFRNENTQSYADLLDICRGKKVILVTATPLNNSVDDIFAQLKLFQAPRSSTIPGLPNLEKYFAGYRTRFSRLDKADPRYQQLISEVSDAIRNDILRYVMVRRTRTDVMTYFKEDMQLQGLTFPEMADPHKLIYEYQGETETVFKETIRRLQEFTYARYTPLLYYVGSKQLSEFERQQQRNVGGFMKSILVKRLESSFYAFRKSINRFIRSHERFIEMFNGGVIYISRKVDVYDLLESDNIERLDELVEEERVHKYVATDFSKNFLPQLEFDLQLLKKIQSQWRSVNSDPKLEAFIRELKSTKALKKNKLVVFTESKETGDYLYAALQRAFPRQVAFYSSSGGRHTDEQTTATHAIARDLIKSNFDPNHKAPQNDLRILITTDVLAEGINLHRANVLVNYDLPWNPTRVLQRAGRVNRLGSKFDQVHIFNFFPTSQSDEHLGLEVNITNKIQLFHDILGEDAKYLSDGEEVSSQELFETLNGKRAYTGEGEEGDSELKYLEIIRNIRDHQPELFDKIKKLPKKARSGQEKTDVDGTSLITFFRLNRLKKFYRNAEGRAEEITFFDAVKELSCAADTPRSAIPSDYYELLRSNKARFELDNMTSEAPAPLTRGRSNSTYIEKRLKDKAFRNYKGFTESNDDFLAGVRKMLTLGTLAKKTAKLIKSEFEKTLDPLQMLRILEKYIRFVSEEPLDKTKKHQKREVILSGYLNKKNG